MSRLWAQLSRVQTLAQSNTLLPIPCHYFTHTVMLRKAEWQHAAQNTETAKQKYKIVTIQFLPAQVWHREFLSMTPWRGSIRPWSFGLPPSYVSGKRMPPSVTDIRRCAKKKEKSDSYFNKYKILIYNSTLLHRHDTYVTVFACLEFYNEGKKTRYEFFFKFLWLWILKNPASQ